MEKSNFIFIVEAERELTVIGRIVATLSRNGVSLTHMTLHTRDGNDCFRITLELQDSRDKMDRLSRRLHKEIDILGVNFFEKN